MKKVLIGLVVLYSTSACNENKQNSTAPSNNESKPTSSTITTANDTAKPGNNVPITNSTLPSAKKTNVTIDKNPSIVVDGSQISTIDYVDDQGADVTEKYYIQKVDNKITLTQIQAMRGVAKGLSKSVYEINASELNANSITVEEIKNKNYKNGKYYAVSIECISGKNCMSHTYEDIGVGKPNSRVETLTQISFVQKTDADTFLATLKASL